MSINKPGQDHVRYEVIAQEDPDNGDLLLPIPQTLLDALSWKPGDTIDFAIDEDGRYILKKI
jgi:hypothetical protein